MGIRPPNMIIVDMLCTIIKKSRHKSAIMAEHNFQPIKQDHVRQPYCFSLPFSPTPENTLQLCFSLLPCCRFIFKLSGERDDSRLSRT